MKFLFFLFLIILDSYSQDFNESQTRFNLTGVMRFRAFDLSKDTTLTRNTSTTPYYNPIREFNSIQSTRTKSVNQYILDRLAGKGGTTLSPNKENLNYFDSRVLLNLEFFTSQYFSGMVGVQIGDMIFGGRSISNTDRNNPAVLGNGSGGELGQQTPVNLRTNFLYLDFKLKEYDFTSRYGIQFFSSTGGRLVFAVGSGAHFTKGYSKYRLTMEWGWIRSRERSFADLDGNTFNDRPRLFTNVAYHKLKWNRTVKHILEFYNYVQADRDPTDLNRETGNLFWNGFYSEWNLGKYIISTHAILNHGTVKLLRSYRDTNAIEIYQTRKEAKISGALWDVQFSYIYNNRVSFNFIGIGTTGRPGFDKNGTDQSYRGGGYRTIFPDFAISNIGIDFTGGYALFNAQNMSGLYQLGTFTKIIFVGPLEITLGYYHLYSNLSPDMTYNREYNWWYGKNRSSTFMGREGNFNIRWNALSDFQIIFRSGLFIPEEGLKALNDTRIGSYIREAFVAAEYRF
jgi:hypothetical protein